MPLRICSQRVIPIFIAQIAYPELHGKSHFQMKQTSIGITMVALEPENKQAMEWGRQIINIWGCVLFGAFAKLHVVLVNIGTLELIQFLRRWPDLCECQVIYEHRLAALYS